MTMTDEELKKWFKHIMAAAARVFPDEVDGTGKVTRDRDVLRGAFVKGAAFEKGLLKSPEPPKTNVVRFPFPKWWKR